MLTTETDETDELDWLYQQRCAMSTDINEHLPTLRALAAECKCVTELGTRAGNSTVAFLAGNPVRLVCYDVARYPHVEMFERLAPPVEFQFHQEDSLKATIEETDLLFIDTWHSYDQLRAELKRHSHKVRKYIVLHDTESCGLVGEGGPAFRGLHQAVKEFVTGRQTFRVKRHYTNNNGLTILERVRPEAEGKPVWEDAKSLVYLALPFYQQVVGQVIDSLDNAVSPEGGNAYAKWYNGGAAHCRNFNDLWCGALNSRHYGWTDFAMIHADVQPRGYWLDVMLREKKASRADFLSVVLPIKTHHGYTSTVLRRKGDGFMRRLTMTEVCHPDMPTTFDGPTAAKALGLDGEWDLLASSGLWVCDFTKPWVEKVWFSDANCIVLCSDGLYRASWVSEDWAFTSILLSMGLKVVASKCVQAIHWGMADYRNDMPWGTEKEDTEACAFGDWYEWPGTTNQSAPTDNGACRR